MSERMFEDGGDEESQTANEIWRGVVAFLNRLLSHIWLFPFVLAFFAVLALLMYVCLTPIFTAYAMIGPPNASPVSAMQSEANSAGQSVRRLLGGGAGGGNDPFLEYQQLLSSSRLVDDLIQKDHLLQTIFASQWDASRQDWYPPNGLHNVVASLKRALNRPVSDHPDKHALQEFLTSQFSLYPATSTTASLLASNSSFMIASLQYGDPQQAERILETVLTRADNIIREEQRRDILARISYLQSELPSVTQTAQRGVLIDILSSQEELKTMMVADKRYAFTLVDPPHADRDPTFPMRPGRAAIVVVLLSVAATLGLVFLQGYSRFIAKLLSPFRRS